MTLLAGERGCRIDQFPDPGIQAGVPVVYGVPVVVVAFVVLGPGGQGKAGGC